MHQKFGICLGSEQSTVFHNWTCSIVGPLTLQLYIIHRLDNRHNEDRTNEQAVHILHNRLILSLETIELREETVILVLAFDNVFF